MNKKGFTLIELLAVIIILGILMIIAIPSVTRYISDSRKSTYVDTAKEIIGGARNIVNGGKLEMYSTNTTYYIPTSCIKTENALKSPYGDFTQAYVGVIYDGKGYKYYWISVDDAGEGVSKITPLDKLDIDDIESDLKDSDIEGVVQTTGIGNRSEIKILKCNTSTNVNSWDGQYQLDDTSDNVPEEGVASNEETSNSSSVVYPEGKDKTSVVLGDIVKIGTEEFYVVKHDRNDLVLLAHYNLNVGSNKKSDETEGIQSKNVVGYKSGKTTYGNVIFSDEAYWKNSIGTIDYPGSYCTYYTGTDCVYVFNNNSTISQYLNNYKNKIGSIAKNARLLKIEEAKLFVDGMKTNELYETSFWLGSAKATYDVWYIISYGDFNSISHNSNSFAGVRPVIII